MVIGIVIHAQKVAAFLGTFSGTNIQRALFFLFFFAILFALTFFGKRKKGSFSYVEIRSAAQEDDYI